MDIPSLESVSPEYAVLSKRYADLNARLLELDAESRDIHRAIAAEQLRNDRGDRIAALAAGLAYQPPLSVRDRRAAIEAERRDISDAIHLLASELAEARRKASRIVVEQFAGEHRRLAREFFGHLAAAVDVHAKVGATRQAFVRAGVDPAGFTDFAAELFGSPSDRSSDVAMLFSDAKRRGLINEIPKVFK